MPLKTAVQSPLADGEEAIAFRAIESVLKNDPVLGSYVRFFSAQRDDDDELKDPEWGLCPYLRIDPAPMQSNWQTEGQHKSDMVIDITIATQGLDVVPLMNFWTAIRHAILPQDQAQSDLISMQLRTAKILKPEFLFAPYRSARQDEGYRFRVGGGRIRFGMFIAT